MNARLRPDIFIRAETTPQVDLPLAADGVQRHLWESRYGTMLIEVSNGQIFVNGGLVTPADDAAPTAGQR